MTRVVEAGVDTWRLLFRTSRAHGKEIFDVGSYKAQWMPALSLLCVEGHPGDGLTPGDALDDAYANVCRELRSEVGRCDFRGLSRLDATATHVFDNGREGVAFLTAMAALDWPRLKPVVWGKPPQTVGLTALNSRGRLLARGYDSGLLRGTHERGEAIRLEDQRRFPSGKRPSRDVFRSDYVRSNFQRRFAPLYQSAKGVKVAGLPVMAKEVARRALDGSMTSREVDQAAGFMLAELAGARIHSRATTYRRKALLRAHGLVLADEFYEPVSVDVGAVLEACLESPLWGRAG